MQNQGAFSFSYAKNGFVFSFSVCSFIYRL
jgi:hypothetical protein